MRRDGVEPEWVGSSYQGKVLGIGSILKFAQKGDQVWTTGIMRRSDGPYTKQANYRALRGPHSAEKVGLLGKVPLGDGALCLPRYYTPKSKPTEPFGIVPHYIDMPHKREWPIHWLGGELISTLTTDVEEFIDQIYSCQFIESSSLHGCIVAQAYGIPWKWVRIGNRLSGDDVKFADFTDSLPHVNIDDLMAARPWISK